MARRVLDKTLDAREARRRLKPRGKPYFRTIERGLHLGYRRRSDAAGPWIARHYLGNQRYEEEPIGHADDFSEPDGIAILDYWQAVNVARDRMKARSLTAAGKSRPFTIADAVADYLVFMKHQRKTADDVRYRMEAHVLPQLGGIQVAALTAIMLRKWQADLAKQPPRLRTKPGASQRHRPLANDDDAIRRRRVSANRCLSQLKAALNRAWRDGKVSSDMAWRKVEPFEGADAARLRYLTIGEAQRLLNACGPDFRLLVQAALETGARYGELVRLTVSDFHLDSGTVAVRISKTGKPRHIVLTQEGIAFFQSVSMGRAGSETLFAKSDGSPWRKSHQIRPMREACLHSKIIPAVGFHQLRHTWASLSVMNGVPLLVVAKNLGHADTRMCERHYGHLASSYITDTIRAGAPRFGLATGNVVAF